jgi:hypothetical protein
VTSAAHVDMHAFATRAEYERRILEFLAPKLDKPGAKFSWRLCVFAVKIFADSD